MAAITTEELGRARSIAVKLAQRLTAAENGKDAGACYLANGKSFRESLNGLVVPLEDLNELLDALRIQRIAVNG